MFRLVVLIFLQASFYKADQSRYECGSHGKFEYCVDDIPGCVIGCHCHPGYYFDTDTKICEPNTKLTQNFRRNYMSEVTVVHMSTQNDVEVTEPTSASPNPVDKKIDEITKDADDLGDWLYNQFFKTIENQVINKTEGDELLTRRSGSQYISNKPKRRSRNLWKRNKKRKKNKKGNLKKKLLRITEDDSLFDSSSKDTSDDTDSSSSDDSSYSTSDSDSETDRRKDHGHKKLVILSKKPKPQLPSFIFLPNIDTPFYPPIGLSPIGLPPPLPVPMYPIAPVPPIGFPIIVHTTSKVSDESKSVTETTSTKAAKNSTTTTTETSTTTGDKNTEANKKSTEKEKSLRMKNSPKKMKSTADKKARNKLLQRLRQRMKAKISPTSFDSQMDYEAPDARFLNLGIPKEQFLSSNPFSTNVMDEQIPRDEVDFKYLSQLIHRPDGNMKNPLPLQDQQRISHTEQQHQRNLNYVPNEVNTNRNTRRQFNAIDKPDDKFYTNLGRQIALMIKNMDADGQRQFNIEIEKSDQKPSSLPLFFENSNSPRSYWERSVRSPMNKYIQELEHIKKSNENLFSLENKVEEETRKYLLSLKELENIISNMEVAKTKFKISNNRKNLPRGNKSLNFNLLHHDYDKYATEKNIQVHENYSNDMLTNHINAPLRRLQGSNSLKFNDHLIKKPLEYDNKSLSIIYNLSKENVTIPKTYLTKLLNGWSPKLKTLKPKPKYKWKPSAGQLNLQYYFGNKNQYEYEKNYYPIDFPPVLKHYKYLGKSVTPSYFHHEVHHFDYFD